MMSMEILEHIFFSTLKIGDILLGHEGCAYEVGCTERKLTIE
ncbi:MAG: hypothetical protein V9E96_05010 [Chitinophagaceae bacterium]